MGKTSIRVKVRTFPASSLILALFLTASLLILPGHNSYWTEWRGDPQHLALENGDPPDVGELIWTYHTGDQVLSSPVFYEGGMLIGSDDKNLYCFDPVTGDVNWKFKTEGEIQASALVHDGKAYFGSFDGNFYCITLPEVGSSAMPSLVWNTTVQGQVISSSHIFKDSVIFADTEGYIYRASLDDGEIIWKEGHTTDQFWATPLIISGSEQLIIGDIWNDLFILDANDGSLEREVFVTRDTEIYASGTIDNGIFFITGGMDQSLHAYDIENDEFLWRFDAEHDTYSTPIVDGDRVYFGSFEYLWCLPITDPDGDGNITMEEIIWSAPTKDFQGGSSPFIASDKIFVGSDDYNLYCFDKTTGDKIWTFETKGYIYSSPAMFDGKVYFGSSDRNVYCVGKRPPGLVMDVDIDVSEITSDNITAIKIKVTNDEGTPIGDAIVSFITSAGFISYDEEGNTRLEHRTDATGNLSVYFFPVHVSSRSTIDISFVAAKEGLQGTSTDVQIIVEPGEESSGDNTDVGEDLEKRIPYYIGISLLVLINIILILLALLWFMRNRFEQKEAGSK